MNQVGGAGTSLGSEAGDNTVEFWSAPGKYAEHDSTETTYEEDLDAASRVLLVLRSWLQLMNFDRLCSPHRKLSRRDKPRLCPADAWASTGLTRAECSACDPGHYCLKVLTARSSCMPAGDCRDYRTRKLNECRVRTGGSECAAGSFETPCRPGIRARKLVMHQLP